MFWEKNLALLTNRPCFANSAASWQMFLKKKGPTSAVTGVVDLPVNTFGRRPSNGRQHGSVVAHGRSERPHARL